jgi:hypothetical protein
VGTPAGRFHGLNKKSDNFYIREKSTQYAPKIHKRNERIACVYIIQKSGFHQRIFSAAANGQK